MGKSCFKEQLFLKDLSITSSVAVMCLTQDFQDQLSNSLSWKFYRRLKLEESWHRCAFYFESREFYFEQKRCVRYKNTKLKLIC
jgi:hypothetical protein